MNDRYRDDYDSRYRSGGYRSNQDRTVEGSGYGGRNWAERTGDEIKSWVGDDDAEARRERDRQTMGRYPGEDRGERNYGGGSGYGAQRYGYGNDRDAYRGGEGRAYGGDRTVQGSGYAGRNWAERTGDEVKSWVGDDDAEARRERDRQTIGRYPGEDRGERNYGSSGYGERSSGYGRPQGDGDRSRHSSDNYGRDSSRTSGFGDDGRRYGGRDDDDRGFFSKVGDEVKSWFGDDEADRRRERDESRAGSGATSSGMLGAATGYSASNFGHDPDYHAYRQARVAEYDRDYHEFRQTKAGQFEKDFSTWRTSKSANGSTDMASKIKEHAEVVGSDGAPVGMVDHVQGNQIKLAKKDSPDGKHHMIPTSWVASVDGNTVKLSKSAADAKREWKDAEQAATTL